jgi:lipopolysaccharide transport system ATP-binding protein
LKPILEIKKISKKFRIQHEHQGEMSFRDAVVSLFKKNSTVKEDFFALEDVSFEVAPGECKGIIGKNGSGKSTLLKVLSKITPPTSGKIISRGRIASLLEVGTGFHPELNGRENIYFNGSILGMRKKEIQAKFDEIVDFSGNEKFLDTPLKHYSSGMQLRLAFAVAAFLEPEILIIDEVLAVGDAEFQKKCIGKMESVSKSGRTILFVSHNMAVLDAICTHAILLNKGHVIGQGETHQVIDNYLNLFNIKNAVVIDGKVQLKKEGTRRSIMQQVEISCNKTPSSTVFMGSEVEIKVTFIAPHKVKQPVLSIIFINQQGITVLGISNKHYIKQLTETAVSEGTITLTIPFFQLMHGFYTLDFHFADGVAEQEVIKDAFTLNVEPKDFSGTGFLPSEKTNLFFMKDVSWKMDMK